MKDRSMDANRDSSYKLQGEEDDEDDRVDLDNIYLDDGGDDASNIFMKSGSGKRGGSQLDQMVLKSSHNSDRYKEAENEGNDNEEGRDDEYDEYGDEIIDLGDDIQPFSMQFKVDDSLKQITGVASKPEVKQKKVEPVVQDEEEEPQLDLMKARKGFDLSEMILGR